MAMIHLTEEGPKITPGEQRVWEEHYQKVFGNHIILRDDFTGKKLTANEFQDFQKIVNKRRPYCSDDFVPQTFIPDLSKCFYNGR